MTRITSALLLLPPPPAIIFECFQDAYKPALSAVYSALAKAVDGCDYMAVLDIALSIPDLPFLSRQRRVKLFPYFQRLLATTYRLIVTICTELNIELDVPGGVDTRLVITEYCPPGTLSAHEEHRSFSQQGPVLDLPSLATSARHWDSIYYLDNKRGQDLAVHFSSYSSANLQPLPAVHDWTLSEAPFVHDDGKQYDGHFSVALGGTFDHFHVGHKLLLTAAALALEPPKGLEPNAVRLLTVGVTVDKLLAKKKYAESLEGWDKRCNSVTSFLAAITNFTLSENEAPSMREVLRPESGAACILASLRPDLDLKLVQLSDPFGPTITEESISALIVSEETRQGGAAVNIERAKKGWASLEVLEIDVLFSGAASPADAERSFESKISSTEIRRRQMLRAKA